MDTWTYGQVRKGLKPRPDEDRLGRLHMSLTIYSPLPTRGDRSKIRLTLCS